MSMIDASKLNDMIRVDLAKARAETGDQAALADLLRLIHARLERLVDDEDSLAVLLMVANRLEEQAR
jgi:hypothetical protein